MIKNVLHYVSIMDRAGEETFIMNVFRTMDRSNIMFDFLVSQNREGDYDKEIKELGGRVRHLQLITTGGPVKRLKNYFVLKNCLKPLHKEYTTFHIHTQHAMDAMLDAMAAKRAGFRKVIVHSHSTSTLHHVKAHYICRPVLNHLPFVRLACSDKAGKWLFGENGKYEVISNGIITEDFLYNERVRDEIRKKEGWNNRTVIGHVGSFLYPKNHSFILDVFSSYLRLDPSALLVFAGKGELMEEVKRKAYDMGIYDNTRFLGSRSDVNMLFSAFDILLFPSHYEGLPVTLVEAQASDLPCLISNVITTETDITQNLRRMSLDQSADEWAHMLSEMTQDKVRNNNKNKIVEAGYDISTTTNRLAQIYGR